MLLFAVLFGSALNLVGDAASGISRLINELSHVIFRIMGMIVRLAPIGVFGAIAFTTSKYGLDSLQHLGSLVGLFYLTCIAFVAVILGAVMRVSGLPMLPFLKYLREELLIVLGTASSDAVLPQIMRKLEHLGIGSSTVGLVIPTGYSFNLDGFSIYLTLAIVFIANATGTPLAMSDLLTILLVSLITSKGAHGIPGSALVILAATLTAIPAIPVVGLVLVLAVDWFMGIGRALTNLIGNCVATVAIARWEKKTSTSLGRARCCPANKAIPSNPGNRWAVPITSNSERRRCRPANRHRLIDFQGVTCDQFIDRRQFRGGETPRRPRPRPMALGRHAARPARAGRATGHQPAKPA
nr:hypothetical protein GCM10020185_45420 [Pseudomonas brassicacearum subsp. brassicacearum]